MNEAISWSLGGLTSGMGVGGMNDESWITNTSALAPTREELENSPEVKLARKQGLPISIKKGGDGLFSAAIQFPHNPPVPGQYDNPVATKFYTALRNKKR